VKENRLKCIRIFRINGDLRFVKSSNMVQGDCKVRQPLLKYLLMITV
jgi:hypothetical protein